MVSYSYPIQKVIVGDHIDLAYITIGEGTQTLLFVHGFASHIPVWEKNIHILKKYYRCVALDLPGHGFSAKKDYPYSIDFYAQTVRQFIEKLSLKDVVLIGHSMGGQIAITLALQYAKLFSRLVLVAPAGFETFNETEKQWLSRFTPGHVIASSQYFRWVLNLKNYFYDLEPQEIAKLQDLNRDFFSLASNPYLHQILANSVRGMVQAPVFDLLPQLTLPTLVFFGKDDQLIPNKFLHPHLFSEQVARKGAGQIRASTLVLYNKAGHFLQYEQPSHFNIDLYKFLTPETFGP
ncbi:alpha/beta fold hydrolase [Microscilla marina]|uniref:Dihydrolipoyllysine-residue acetyltransferase component of acetoincleaving system n=1 Tax=Microscilla marina ATCC 23134 TaxID=313606 RepID=A1ZH38_MICM2|nr:alpha/beta hydrolase [Microscilla marina]EAY30307.1 dihydrolipoyllysine-residue acetyltransferase component of acetoincleaving system [Microscilla marina ATCC 23134]